MSKKRTIGNKASHNKQTVQVSHSHDSEQILFVFDQVDNDGDFAFLPSRADFDSKLIIQAILNYSKMTWQEILTATHGKYSKSKNHMLDVAKLTDKAYERISKLHLEEETDALFSLRLEGRVRIIGFRHENKFIVKLYDPKHGFSKMSD